MKGTKYGKNAQKSIYITEADKSTWKKVVDHAEDTRDGIGSILMTAYRFMMDKKNHKVD